MKEKQNADANHTAELLSRLKSEEFCYLTTTGRVSGLPHEIEIWFGLQNNTLYLLSDGGDKSDWVKNLRKNPDATLRIGSTTLQGTAVWREDTGVKTEVLPLFLRKYFLAKVFKWIGWYKQEFAFEITPIDG